MATQQREAMRTLHDAFEHLRPRMAGDYSTPPNDEAKAGSTLASAMLVIIKRDGGFCRPLGGPLVQAPIYRTCPVCNGATVHADGCTASLDPTLTATWGTLLKQTADELETCWRSLGQINPNRHVTAARKLLGE